MPKILINEVDNTSAGTPGRYGNFAVLITGYKGEPSADETKWQSPDENGVYEFSSSQAFKDTIGISGIEKSNASGNPEYHYGNRMAYELLNLGYTVIYKVIDHVAEMDDENFWAIFKDKASYDFRFVSHGMLETCYDSAKHTELYERLNEIKADVKKLAEIKNKAAAMVAADPTIGTELEQQEALYTEVINAGYTGFLNDAGLKYSTFAAAEAGLGVGTDESAESEQEALIAEHNTKHFTLTVFNNINGHIAKLATYRSDDAAVIPGRGDCVALIELDEDSYFETSSTDRPEALIIEGINSITTVTKAEGPYCAMTVPSVFYKMNKDIVKFPGAFHYLACFMNSLRSGFAEWYAAAGYTRGVSSYIIDHTSVKLGEIAINALEPRNKDANGPKFACNVIANFRGSYYLWGNRTAAELATEDSAGDLTAEHFLNIRQLCSTIKKQLYTSCRRFTFDPNSDTLWINFVNSITPTLDAMKADQGIRDYRVIKEVTDKKATLKARIRIIPIEAVEDFDITVSLEDTFGETSVTAEG